MIGLARMEQRLAASSNDELVLWLEMGLRAILDEKTSEGNELAFSPLILARDTPPLQQFHAAVEALPGAIQARLRWACGALLGSLRAQDNVRYIVCLWSVAIALRPPTGLLAAARHLLRQIGTASDAKVAYRRVVDHIVTAALSYPRSSEHQALVSDIRAYDLWTVRYSQQLVIFLIATQPAEWADILLSFRDEIAPIDKPNGGIARRLIKTIGPDELGRRVHLLNESDGLDWFRPAVEANAHMQLRGDSLYVEVGDSVALIPETDMPAEPTEGQALAILSAVDQVRQGDEAHARARMASSLNSPRLLQLMARRSP